MMDRPARNRALVLTSVHAAGLGLAILHPLAPLLLVAGVAAVGILLAYQHLILASLANLGVVKAFLISTVPALTLFDPTLILAGLALLVILWRLTDTTGRAALNRHGHLLMAFVAWLTWMLLAVVHAPDMPMALQKAGRFILIVPLLFLGPLVLIRSARDSRIVLYLFVAYAVMAAGLLFLKLWGLVSGTITDPLTHRLSILGANPISIARLLVVAASMILAAWARQKTGGWRWLPLLGLLLTAALLTGSRGPILSLLAAWVLIGLLHKGRPRRIFFGGLVGIGLVISLFLGLAPAELTKRYLAFSAAELKVDQQGLQISSSVSSRYRLYEIAYDEWTSKPSKFFFGSGTAGYAALFPWRDFRYPHNLFLELLVEFGLLGALVFCWQVVLIIPKLFTRATRRLSTEAFMWLAGTFTFFFSTMFSGDLNDNRLLWFLVAAYLASWSLSPASKLSPRRI